MKNWRTPPDFRGLFPDQPDLANELLKDYLRVEHGLPLSKPADSSEKAEENEAEHNPYVSAREKLHRAVTKYLKQNDPACPAFSDVQASLASLGRVFYSRRGYHGLRTLFSRWTSETIERDLLASKSFIEPLFTVHSPEKYALAHREARNTLRHFAEYLLSHLSRDQLNLLTSIGELDRVLKNTTGLTVDTLVPVDLCIQNALTGRPFPERDYDESYLIAESYLLAFMHSWNCRPGIENSMVAMRSAQERIITAIKDKPAAPERDLYLSAKKVANNWESLMQKIELSQESVLFIHCPFCGQAVMGEEMAPEVNPCPHTLFLGTDEGFEYASDFFQSACEKQLDDGYDSMNVHDAIATVKLPDAVCFTMVAPPVSMLNCHAAFIGLDQDE